MPSRKGGKFINSGTYGCVFSPSLPCARKLSKVQGDTAGKVFNSPHEAKNEAQVNSLINRIDPNKSFTIKALANCKVNINDAHATDEVYSCKFVDDASYTPTYKQIIYEFGGKDLDYLIDNYHSYAAKGFYFDELIPLLLPLFEGLVIMNEKGIAHSDIKPANILLNFERRRITLVDFGLLTKKSRFFSRTYPHFYHRYAYYPPEFKLFRMMYENGRSITFADVLAKVQENYKNWDDHGKSGWEFIHEHFNATNELRNTFVRHLSYASKTNMKKQEIPQVFNKLDTFSLGMSILEIWFYTRHRLRNKKSSKVCQDFIKSVVLPMIRFDVEDRCTPQQALENMRTFIKTTV